MKTLCLLLTGMIAVVATAQVGAEEKAEKPDYAKLIVGKWEATKADNSVLVGGVFEFAMDGKLKITHKEKTSEVGYKIIGDQIQPFEAGEKKGPPIIILKISDKELIVEGPGKIKVEFKRIP